MTNVSIQTAGLVIPTPGERKGDSGHVATQMIIEVMNEHHDSIHIFTQQQFELQDTFESVTIHRAKRPFKYSPAPLRILGFFLYQILLATTIIHQIRIELIIYRGSGLVVPILAGKVIGSTTIHQQGAGRIRNEILNQHNNISIRIKSYIAASLILEEIERSAVDAIVVISESMIEFSELDDYRAKTYIWNHYVFDLDRFDSRVPYNRRNSIIGFAGEISQVKGIPELIESMDEVAHKHGNIKFLIAGDGAYYNKMERQIEKFEIKNRVITLGHVPREKMPSIYNRLTLFILPSKTEGVPKVVLEAMACGTPVICTNVGGITDIVEHGTTGFLLSEQSSSAITETIEEALSSDLARMSARCVRYVSANYSFQSTLETYAEVVSNIHEQ